MSVATQYAPAVPVQQRVRSARSRLAAAPDRAPLEPSPVASGPVLEVVRPSRPALVVAVPDVVRLRAPGRREAVAPVRLTHRGILVLVLAVAALGGVLVWLAALSAPSAAAQSRPSVPSIVTVAPGDTLWSIAGRAAPERDPRAEVATLQRLNRLAGVDLVPGQRLRVR